MVEVTDFSSYTEAELRKILIDNATPACSGMDRVVREIKAKYNACDREMLLWFINRPPYNGKLWVSNPHRVLTAEEYAREERRLEIIMEREQKKRIAAAAKKVPRTHVVVKAPLVKPPAPPPKKDIMVEFRKLGCKPVLIADKVLGIKRMGSYAKIDELKATFSQWEVVEYD